MKAIAGILLVAGFGVAAAVLRAGDACDPSGLMMTRVLYLRNGRAADRIMLSFDALAADVYWMRAIQHYGRDRKSARLSGRFELLYPLLDLATTLDPDFNVAYRLGAVFLAQPPPNGPDRVDLAIALLQKGLAHNPTQWKYALDIGFLYYWYGTGGPAPASDFLDAVRWFDRAMAMPGAPNWIRPLAAITRAQGGDRTGARHMLTELAKSDESWIRNSAARGLAQIQAMDDIDLLQTSVDRYLGTTHAPPKSWDDLVHAGLIRAPPVDPANAPYDYNRATNHVVLSPASPLSPLPRTLERK
jgi:hypothetical protein